MLNIARSFQTAAEPISAHPHGNGHINNTYLVTDASERRYILQKINTNVFKNPIALMANVSAVTTHLRKKGAGPREALSLVPCTNGSSYFVDERGGYFRMYDFIEGSLCLESAWEGDAFYQSAVGFGGFQRQMADFPAETLHETIPHFHDTVSRFADFKKAIAADVCGRTKDVQQEIDLYLSFEGFAATLVDLQKSGEMPLRVTHNDTKLNNVLLDAATKKALCVIDLDTVMPGLSVTDFGDAIRFGASTALEDEPDASKVSLSLPLFESFAKGFLESCGGSLTPIELAHLVTGSKMMTLECGSRFLADFLSGDTYYHTSRPGQNLDRCRTQLALLLDMQRKEDQMRKIIESLSHMR